MKLAKGDDLDVVKLILSSIRSGSRTAFDTGRDLIENEKRLDEMVFEIEGLLDDCDLGHLQLLQKFPDDADAKILSSQWESVALILKKIMAEIKVKSGLHRKRQSQEDFALSAVIHSILNTRMKTFEENGLFDL